MNQLAAQLVASDLGLATSEVVQTPGRFLVRSKLGGPRILFALLFALPALFLLFSARTGETAVLVAAAVVSPALLAMSVLFAAFSAEKSFDRATGFVARFSLLGRRTEVSLPWPTSGRVLLVSESRGSAKGAPGAARRYRISVQGVSGSGFVASRDYFAARAFAERLAGFLSLSVEDGVPPALQVGP